jgi:hypothetical protein
MLGDFGNASHCALTIVLRFAVSLVWWDGEDVGTSFSLGTDLDACPVGSPSEAADVDGTLKVITGAGCSTTGYSYVLWGRSRDACIGAGDASLVAEDGDANGAAEELVVWLDSGTLGGPVCMYKLKSSNFPRQKLIDNIFFFRLGESEPVITGN